MRNKELPKVIKSTVTDDLYYLTFEKRNTDKGWRYIIHYLNPLRKECLFLVDSYKDWPKDEMYGKLAEDKFWKKVK